MRHLIHVLLVVFVATFASVATGIGVTLVAPLYVGALVCAALTLGVVVLGVGMLIGARFTLGLAQAGKLVQMVLFWLLTSLALYLVPQSVLTIQCAWLTGFSVLALTLLLATVTGGFASGFKRSWLPVFRKRS